ncbi:MAG: ABC transporter permease [Anaerolineales bacterium]
MMKYLRTNLRLFMDGALLSYIALFRWLRPSTYIASMVVGPLAYMFFFVFLGKYATGAGNVAFYVIGNAVQMVAFSGIYGVTMSISGDRWDGTLPYLFGTPANRFFLFFGRAFMHVINGAFSVVISFIWGVLLLGLDLSNANLPALAATILATAFSTCCLGLLFGSVALMTRNVMFVNNTVFFLMLFFSGANIALDTLPAWMRTISFALPLTRGIAAARQIVAGADLSDVAPLLGGEVGFGVIYVAIGFVMFSWFEYQAKRKGTLEAV